MKVKKGTLVRTIRDNTTYEGLVNGKSVFRVYAETGLLGLVLEDSFYTEHQYRDSSLTQTVRVLLLKEKRTVLITTDTIVEIEK